MYCGAKTRSGEPCKKAPVKEKNRCANHGGLTKGGGAPKGSQNALVHGIFSNKITREEMNLIPLMNYESLDDELLLMKVRLSRALEAEYQANGAPELEEVTKNVGGGEGVARETRKSKVKDYYAIIDKIVGRIESLTKTRAALIALNGGSGGKDVIGFEVIEYDD